MLKLVVNKLTTHPVSRRALLVFLLISVHPASFSNSADRFRSYLCVFTSCSSKLGGYFVPVNWYLSLMQCYFQRLDTNAFVWSLSNALTAWWSAHVALFTPLLYNLLWIISFFYLSQFCEHLPNARRDIRISQRFCRRCKPSGMWRCSIEASNDFILTVNRLIKNLTNENN
jgi:hypothetical protein